MPKDSELENENLLDKSKENDEDPDLDYEKSDASENEIEGSELHDGACRKRKNKNDAEKVNK